MAQIVTSRMIKQFVGHNYRISFSYIYSTVQKCTVLAFLLNNSAHKNSTSVTYATGMFTHNRFKKKFLLR